MICLCQWLESCPPSTTYSCHADTLFCCCRKISACVSLLNDISKSILPDRNYKPLRRRFSTDECRGDGENVRHADWWLSGMHSSHMQAAFFSDISSIIAFASPADLSIWFTWVTAHVPALGPSHISHVALHRLPIWDERERRRPMNRKEGPVIIWKLANFTSGLRDRRLKIRKADAYWCLYEYPLNVGG